MKKVLFAAFFICVELFSVCADEYLSWNFEETNIKDILFSISLDSGISIVCDDSVQGKAGLHFAGSDFDEAFDAFLRENRLCVYKNEKKWTVSKASVFFENGMMILDAYDLTAEQILEKISLHSEWRITFDSLPMQKISVHFRGTETEVFENLARRFGNYDVFIDGKNCCFVKKNENRRADENALLKVERTDDGSFSVNVRDVKMQNAVEYLFSEFSEENSGNGFCFLDSAEMKIQRSNFYAENFNDVLNKLCMQNGFNFVVQNGLYYIFSDSTSKSELLEGEKKWNSFSLKYESAQDFIPLVLKKIGSMETLVLPVEGSFLCKCNDGEKQLIEELIALVDVQKTVHIINLKYKTPAEFMEHLPPYIEKSSLFLADNSKSLYFRGTEDSYMQLCSQIELFDVPEKRLSYDLLILQYDQMSQEDWSSSLSVKRLSLGDRNSVSAMLGSVMAFNLNVVTAFGLGFAAELQSSIENNKTKVFADTTLHGVSGKQISFQNTNTYRYRDNNLDPATGKPVYSGVTKEIISGIKLDVTGWISGDGVITSKVTASVSRRGTDTSSSTGNPPPTTEKIITTEVCGKSGEPVVLSGLIMNSESESEKGVPFISKIPVIGKLFKSKAKSEENSQMVIFLVPHFENAADFEKTESECFADPDLSFKGKGKNCVYDYEWAEQKINEVKILLDEEKGGH